MSQWHTDGAEEQPPPGTKEAPKLINQNFFSEIALYHDLDMENLNKVGLCNLTTSKRNSEEVTTNISNEK